MMMQCLAFGLMAALLLDATVIRMFLVPSVMKLLGDDCWWAPMWMKRLQNRIGLGEIHLPDERKRPVPRARVDRPAVARPPVAAPPRPPHDPTHPGAEIPTAAPVPPRPARPAGPAPRPDYRPATPETPSAAGTSKMRAPGRSQPSESPTTRFSAQPNPAPTPVSGRESAPAPARGEDREIESWLSELRGNEAKANGPTPSDDQTRAMHVAKEQVSQQPAATEDPEDLELEDQATTAIPTPPREDKDPNVATQKLNARGNDSDGNERSRRRGGGLSAQDLLRREGRI
jgi:trehalose monomycolate/heme transporter